MICEECGRNDAIVHIVQIGPGGRSEKNICMSCAARYGASILRAQQENVSAEDFLKGIFGSNKQEPAAEENAPRITCPNCGMKFQDFPQTGQILPSARVSRGSSTTLQARCPSRWYFPSSG